MSRFTELRDRVAALDKRILELADKDRLTPAENREWHSATAERDDIFPTFERLRDRAKNTDVIKSKSWRAIDGIPKHENDDRTLGDITGAALRSLDKLTDRLPADRADAMEAHIRTSPRFAEEFAAFGDPAYERAWWKIMYSGETRGYMAMTEDERGAMARAMQASETRALSEGTPAAGGYAVPVAVDPSIIMSAQGSGNPLLDNGNVFDVVTNKWTGVATAGVSWSFDPEASAVSDDSPTLAQPSIDVFMARGFIPFSMELEQDWAGFQAEMARLLQEGYSELLADKMARGSGVAEPRGLITALDANTNSEVVTTTDGAFGREDIYKVWKALPERFRNRASWVMSADVYSRVKQMETPNGALVFPEMNNPQPQLLTRPVFTSAYFPDFTGTTGSANIMVIGDLSRYYVARRAMMRVEIVPHLVDTTSNRPTGQRGWFAHARIGSNTATDNAFRLLQNQ